MRLLRAIALAVATRGLITVAVAATVYVALPLVFPKVAASRSVQDTITDIRSGLRELERVLESRARG